MTSKQVLYTLFALLLAVFMALFVYLHNLPMDGSNVTQEYDYAAIDWERLSHNEEALYMGEMQYKIRCSKCHGLKGQGGLSAPALNDDVHIYANTYESILHIVRFGSPTREMMGWDTKLQPKDLAAITVYVKQLQSSSSKTK
jgi:mono/diheme cytochrome c family protein